MAWEDGQQGVFRLDTQTTVGVQKRHQLIDADDAKLTEHLVHNTEKHYTTELFGPLSNRLTNEPNMSRANMLLAIGGDVDTMVRTVHAAPSQVVGAGVATPVPSKTPAASTVAAQGDTVDEGPSILDLIRPTSAWAKAEAKAKAKGTGKGPQANRGTSTSSRQSQANKRANSTKEREKDLALENAKPWFECGEGALVSTAPPVPAGEPSAKRVKTEEEGSDAKQPLAPAAEDLDNGEWQLNEADQSWADESLKEFKDLMRIAPREADTEFKIDVTEYIKRCTSMVAAIRARKRTIKRRKEQSDAMEHAVTFEAVVLQYGEFLRTLLKPASGGSDTVHLQLEQFVSKGATFGVEIYRRVAKAMISDDAKWKRWDALVTTTWKFLQTNMVQREAEPLYFQQVTVVLQKLLKGIPVEKAQLRS